MPKHAAATPQEPANPQHLASREQTDQPGTQEAQEAPQVASTRADSETPKADVPASKKANPRLIIAAICALVAGLCILVTSQGTSSEIAAGSMVVTKAEVIEPDAKDLLSASDYADTLFSDTEHRELSHEGGFENVLDDEILGGTQAFSELADAVGEIEDRGYDIGIMLIDLTSGGTFAYNADETFYSASSIKGPYVISLYEELAETGEVSLDALNSYALPIIEYSDNGAYSSLHRRFGGDPFQVWLEEIGYDLGEYDNYDEVSDHFYLHINAEQLAALWLRAYPYLSSDAEGAELLAEYFESRETSAIGAALGERYVTWAKAGWYPSNDGYAHPATVDAGIVLADHPYVVAVLTNIPADVKRLEPVFSALDGLHEGLYLIGTDFRIEPES